MSSTAKRLKAKASDLHLTPAVWIFLIVFIARLFALIRLSTSPYFLPEGSDMRFYSDWALRIAGGDWTDGRAFYGLPGYPFLLAGIYKIAGYNPFLVGLLQAVTEGFVGVLIYRIAAAVFLTLETNAVGWIAAIGWAVFQPAQAFSIILMPTTWLVLGFWAVVYRVMQCKREWSAWNPWLGVGLVIGVVAMLIATIMLLIPLVIAAVWFATGSTRPLAQRVTRFAAATALLYVGLLTGTAPCWAHNYFIAKEPVFLSAHSGVNFYLGNNPIANGYPRIPPGLRAGQEGMLKDSISMAEAATGRKMQRSEVSQYWSEKAGRFIREHPTEWLRLMAVKFRNFWSAFQYDDLSVVNLLAGDGVLLPGIRFGLIAALGIPGMILAVRNHRRSWWIVAAVFLHLAALMPVFITERYRLAVVPGLLIFAALGVVECWKFLAQALWTRAAGYAALACAATLFVGWPHHDKSLWALDFYELGIKATEAHDFHRAQKNLELAYAYVPENSEINFALGNLWLENGDRTRSKAFYRRAIEINPRHASAWNNLGVLAMQEHRLQLAEKFFTNSILSEPDSAKTYYLLAKTKLELGELPDAKQCIDRAVRLRPQQKEFLALQQEIASRASAP
jgi:tetratricopeptide (TPR) repeat protein